MKDIIQGVAVCSPCDVSTLSVKHVSHWPIFPSEQKSMLPAGPSLPFSSPQNRKLLRMRKWERAGCFLRE